jgi:hypothetical protein
MRLETFEHDARLVDEKPALPSIGSQLHPVNDGEIVFELSAIQ